MSDVATDTIDPRIRQVSFFLPNRLGSLRRALDLLEAKDIRIGGLSILESTDHAVVRLVVNRPEEAYETLSSCGYGGCVTELLCVVLHARPRLGIVRVLALLLSAEVSVQYAYALIVQAEGNPLLALQVDDLNLAARVLVRSGFTVAGHDQIQWPAPREP